MKVWSAIFNFIAIWIIIIMIMVMYHHLDAIQTDYDTAVLRQAIEYAGEAAFRGAVIESGDINMDYTDLGNVSINPSESLRIFEDMICLSYGLSLSDENREHIESYIPSAILCTYDGYYITQISKDNIASLQWSLKIPYTMETTRRRGAQTVECTVALRMDSEQCFVIDKDSTDGKVNSYQSYGMGVDGAGFLHSTLNREIANVRINAIITDALAYNISKISADRGGKNYRVYLPAEQTFSGINSIQRPSLIILLSGADFAGKAKVYEAAISGLKVITRNWVIGFTDGAGKKWYCYESQIPKALLKDPTIHVNDRPFTTVMDAAKNGYNPHYEYLSLPINKNY